MKRRILQGFFSLICLVVFLLPAPSVALVSTPEVVSSQAEYEHALLYPFVPEELRSGEAQPVTYAQYTAMLKDMLALYDENLIPGWEKTAMLALKSSDAMGRDDGMLATYYAACLMGMGTPNGNWHEIQALCGENCWDDMSWDYWRYFPAYQQSCPFEDIPGRLANWDYMTGAYMFCLGHYSNGSGQTLFDCELENRTMRCGDPFTRREAVLAAARLYESGCSGKSDPSRALTQWETDFLAKADARRAGIVDAPTAIQLGEKVVQGETYKGKAYYVSPNGDDQNDGLTPETAWATLDKVNKAKLGGGSAVLFERGGQWYGTLKAKAKVTYSAYGVGDKPRLMGVEDVGAGSPENWTLHYEDASGQKIWRFAQPLALASGIFFGDGSVYASQLVPQWHPQEGFVLATLEETAPVNVTADLDRDLMYFCDIDMKGYREQEDLMVSGRTGELYLRCDKGNPAQVFDAVHLSLVGNGVDVEGKQVTLDNLCILYYGGCGIGCNGSRYSGALIQNCEIGWCGGYMKSFRKNVHNEYYAATISGTGLHIAGKDLAARNNYLHDCDGKAFTIAYQVRDKTKNQNIQITGNLVERCNSALTMCNFADVEQPKNKFVFKDVLFDDNMVLHNAEYWGYERMKSIPYAEGYLAAVNFSTYRNRNENVRISNNVFYLSRSAMVYGMMEMDQMPIFSGNTFVQYNQGLLATWDSRRYGFPGVSAFAQSFARNVLGDQTAVAIGLE